MRGCYQQPSQSGDSGALSQLMNPAKRCTSPCYGGD